MARPSVPCEPSADRRKWRDPLGGKRCAEVTALPGMTMRRRPGAASPAPSGNSRTTLRPGPSADPLECDNPGRGPPSPGSDLLTLVGALTDQEIMSAAIEELSPSSGKAALLGD